MQSKTSITIASALVIIILLAGACSIGFLIGQFFVPENSLFSMGQNFLSSLNSNDLTDGQSLSSELQPGKGTSEEIDKLFVPFWQAWDLVHDQFVDQPVDNQALMRGAIRGMLDALGDEHSSYLDPEHYEMLNNELQGREYEGIGAWVDIRGEFLTIISPMPGSPAESAGLRPGDKVIAVDGEDMTGVDGEIVRQHIIGPVGTKVRLTIFREGNDEPFDVEITRESITVPSVDSRMLDENIAYIQLFTFGDDTTKDLRNSLKELMAQNPTGLILDLRNNGGGYRDTAIEVASEFVADGVIMLEKYGDGREKVFRAKRGGLATDIPIVVLINEGSASASEIVAGAIRDHDRGKLVGTTSFGKGSVQSFSELADGQGAIRVTIARWLTPNGETIHGIGLKPDFIVEYKEEDYNAGKDPQLDRAIEILKRQ
jgi:carboxyl-terminal processing protease